MAVTSISKHRLGYEDLLIDQRGVGLTSSVEMSNGRSRQVRHLNAELLPVTLATRAKTRIGTGTPATTQTDVDGILQELYTDLAKIGEPDDSTVEVSSGILQVKDDGITADKLRDDASTDANRAVTQDHIRDEAISAAKLESDAVTTAKILDSAVTTAKINDFAVTEDKLASSAVTNAKIADDTIRPGKLNMDNQAGAESTPAAYIVATGVEAVGTGSPTHTISFTTLVGSITDYRAFITVEDATLATAAAVGFQALQSAELDTLSSITLTFNGNVTTGGNVYWQIIKLAV